MNEVKVIEKDRKELIGSFGTCVGKIDSYTEAAYYLLHNLYAPTQKEVDHARRVVEAAEAAAREGLGVVSLNGKMVDGPVIDRARLVLSRAELSGIREE